MSTPDSKPAQQATFLAGLKFLAAGLVLLAIGIFAAGNAWSDYQAGFTSGRRASSQSVTRISAGDEPGNFAWHVAGTGLIGVLFILAGLWVSGVALQGLVRLSRKAGKTPDH